MACRLTILTALLLAPGCSSVASNIGDLESKEYEDRKEAIISLAARLRAAAPGELEDADRERILRPIRQALGDSSAMVRSVAIRALESLDDRSSIPRIASLLRDGSWLVRLSALQALRALEAKDEVPSIATILRDDPKNHCRREAAMTLGALGSLEGVEACIAALSERESDSSVRVAAHDALQAISGRELPLRQEDWRRWWEQHRAGGALSPSPEPEEEGGPR